MIVDPMLLEGGYNLLSDQFNAKYKDEIAELFAIITNEGTGSKAQERDDYEKRVQAFTDYRTYLSFDLEVINREGESQRLSKTLGKNPVAKPRLHFILQYWHRLHNCIALVGTRQLIHLVSSCLMKHFLRWMASELCVVLNCYVSLTFKWYFQHHPIKLGILPLL